MLERKRIARMHAQIEPIDWLEDKYARPILVEDGCRSWLADTPDRLKAESRRRGHDR